MPKLTPEQLLRSIAEFPDEASMDEDVEAVLAMTPEEIEAELVAAGHTRAELDADADELLGPAPKTNATGTPVATPVPTADATDGMTPAATPAAEPAKVVSLASRRRRVSRWVVLLPVAAAFALVAMEEPALVAWWTGEDVRVTHGYDPVEYAGSLRHQAARAIDAKAWSQALELLEKARGLDPAGDGSEEVRRLRQLAREGLDGGGAR
jgi:hypothetical protein